MIGAGLSADIEPTEAWAKEHPGEKAPLDQCEVVIRLMGLEVRPRAVLAAGNQPQVDQKAIPLRVLARVPLPLWDQTMTALFNGAPALTPEGN